MTTTRTLTFPDNALMPDLCGPHDSHLLLIENKLGVKVLARGNEITLSGPEDAYGQAEAVLQTLYARLEEKLPLGTGDVEAALRFTEPAGAEAQPSANGPVLSLPKRTITARTKSQVTYLEALADHELTFGVGPAGTGKTYLAVAHAAFQFKNKAVSKIILSRPAVEAGERIGFLPGDMKDKVDPYLRPLYDALYDMFGKDFVDTRIEKGDFEIAPLAFMRGRTLSDAIVVLDEAQNATIAQMKMFLTRLGRRLAHDHYRRSQPD